MEDVIGTVKQQRHRLPLNDVCNDPSVVEKGDKVVHFLSRNPKVVEKDSMVGNILSGTHGVKKELG